MGRGKQGAYFFNESELFQLYVGSLYVRVSAICSLCAQPGFLQSLLLLCCVLNSHPLCSLLLSCPIAGMCVPDQMHFHCSRVFLLPCLHRQFFWGSVFCCPSDGQSRRVSVIRSFLEFWFSVQVNTDIKNITNF